MKSMVLKVRGMTCMHCKANVEQALMQMSGVKEAEVHLQKGEVSVTFDDAVVDLEEIREEIEEIGYEVEG
ncbi:MAG TPA: heavy-metal-associated domain-containing protein [Syntrophothermus lipocalidus]|nr:MULTISPECIES: copper ion binding protein [Syntrophothermus]NSW83875.1 heavy-metal-associated domain-containing protein [Syntrophothermus sp.]HHV76699.1 heavy-metal-associated domain-containing protein [Syntrophothermus lipocalidus]HOV42674.1 copper ion binding protein [Syntrophothermus lipocalidus]